MTTQIGFRILWVLTRLVAGFHTNGRIPQWEEAEALKWRMQPPLYSFPPPDLLFTLVDSFFQHINPYAPLLHRPTFDSLVANNTHVYDPTFAKVLLLVCANGARFVDDPRVRLPGAPHRSAGWSWYTQTEITRPDLLAPPTLYRVQAYVLAVIFLGGLFNVRGLWMVMNTALRFMLELGVHRQKVYRPTPRPEDELWKRCFWYVGKTSDGSHLSTFSLSG